MARFPPRRHYARAGQEALPLLEALSPSGNSRRMADPQEDINLTRATSHLFGRACPALRPSFLKHFAGHLDHWHAFGSAKKQPASQKKQRSE
jgi:hypothetical protein